MAEQPGQKQERVNDKSESKSSHDVNNVYSNVYEDLYGAKSKEQLQSSNSATNGKDKGTTNSDGGYLDMDTGAIVDNGNVPNQESVSTRGDKTGENSVKERDGKGATKVAEQFFDYLSNNFQSLDLNGDGRLSREEFGANMLDSKKAAKQDGTFVAAGYQLSKGLEQTAGTLARRNGENTGEGKMQSADTNQDTKAGITRQNVKSMKEALGKVDSPEAKESSDIASLADHPTWSKVDLNGDETLTHDEINEAKGKDNLPEGTKEKLDLLVSKFSDVSNTTDDTVHVTILSGGAALPGYKQEPAGLKDNPDLKFVSKKDVQHFGDSREFLRELGTSIGEMDQHRKSGAQGKTGSCFVLAPIQAMNEKNPEMLKSMVKTNHLNDTSTVTFPNDKENPITINNPTDAELATYAGGSSSIEAILEKAYAQFHANDFGEADKFNGKLAKEGLPVPIQESLRDGGSSSRAMEVLTGNKADYMHPLQDNIGQFLERANDKNQLVAAASKPDTPDDSGIIPGHAYTISSFDKANGKVEIINPYNGQEPLGEGGKPKDGVVDGKFKVDLKDFQEHFHRVFAVSMKKPK